MQIAIPEYFGLLNLHAVTGKKTNMYYNRYSLHHGKASECLKCGLCEKMPPAHPHPENAGGLCSSVRGLNHNHAPSGMTAIPVSRRELFA